ncbi:MAG: hypothetical protein ABIH55_03405 [Nanoarchaeota archaeon]|nr:hypothetical protein [Nanoarchaeota archaeon]MBU1135591.1 hypothetical protein [Nanoarchaeota archaeon]
MFIDPLEMDIIKEIIDSIKSKLKKNEVQGCWTEGLFLTRNAAFLMSAALILHVQCVSYNIHAQTNASDDLDFIVGSLDKKPSGDIFFSIKMKENIKITCGTIGLGARSEKEEKYLLSVMKEK